MYNSRGNSMKKLALILAALLAVFMISGPALAASLGMSPSKVEVEVPADGSATVDLKAYYFSGDIQITLVDIPLTVTPETVHVDAIDNPQDFTLTIHGDPSLGSKIYDGYIRFLGGSGEMIAVAVKVKARVTNLVAGQEPVLVAPPTTSTPAAAAPTETPVASEQQLQPSSTGPGGVNVVPSPQNTENSSDVFAGLSLNMVILIAGGLVFLGLIILAISLVGRRRRF
jgi:hypothetical protein